MKRIVLLASLLISVFALRAQDTVRYGDPWYTFNQVTILSQYNSEITAQCHLFIPENLAGDYGIQAYPNTTNTIYGIALTIDTIGIGPIGSVHHVLTPENEPRLLLIESMQYHCVDHYAIGTAARAIDSIGKIDTLDLCQAPRRQCYFDYHFGYDFINHQPTSDESIFTSNCYEFYFDNPIELKNNGSGTSDTFYIGGLTSSYITDEAFWWGYQYTLKSGTDSLRQQPWWVMRDKIPGYLAENGYNAITGIFGGIMGNTPDEVMHSFPTMMAWGVVFPIVHLRCVAPWLSFVGKDAGMATVAWRQNDTPEQYQLSIAPWDITGTDPDSGAMFYTTDTSFTFTDLQPDTRYSVWVRKACRYTTSAYDTIVWSDWSNEIIFMFVDIDEVEADGMRITSQRGSIVVEGAEGREVRVYDMLGRELTHSSVSVTADSSPNLGEQRRIAVPTAGIYMVRVGNLPTRKVAVVR